MLCSEIIHILEKQSPPEYALSWDNVGLLVGRKDREVHKLLLAVDASMEVVDFAIQQHFDMIITHHPMIFGKIGKVNDETPLGRKILALAEHGICCYAMHTNFDTRGGMAKLAAKQLLLQNTEVLEETMDGEGIGQIGFLPTSMMAEELAALVKEKFGLKNVIFYGDNKNKIEKVAICPGSGKSVISISADKGAQCLITGDIGHHEGVDACELGICVIDASHYGLEKIFLNFMYEYLQGYCMDVEIQIADTGEPFAVL